MNRLSSFQTITKPKTPTLVFYDDTSSFANWTSAGFWGTYNYLANWWFSCSTNGKYLYRNTGLSSLKGTKIVFNATLSGGCPFLYFGCNSAGAGNMFRFDSRGGANRSGFASTTSWTSWGSPSNSITYSWTQNTWTEISIVINSAGVATFYVNGVAQDAGFNYTITDNGGYIGMQSDYGGTTSFQVFHISVYKI